MCLLCIEIKKQTLSIPDFIKNYDELAKTDPKHAKEVKENFPEFAGFSLFEEEQTDELPWYFLTDHFDD